MAEQRNWCCFYDARPLGHWVRYVDRDMTERDARATAARADIRRPYVAQYA